MALDMHRRGISRKGQMEQEAEKELFTKIITPEYPIDPLELLGERNFDEPRIVPEEEIGSPVQEFFRGVNVFVTGGTGFMGKILLEKLLRTCPHIKHIYLLVRMKKGKSPELRKDEIFQDRLYKRVKHEVPNFYEKVSVMNGNLEAPRLGLSDEDRKIFIENVNIIFHGAATVRFDEKIKLAISINVLGTEEIIKLAKETKNLKVMMHVSTAYSFCIRSEVEEKFYDMPVNYRDVINQVSSKDDEELELKTKQILGEWPNTYTFTKALAESLIKEEGKGLPIGVFRPSVIISTYREPVRGWIDNVYGPIGVIIGVGTGILHVYETNLDSSSSDMVPVDLVVNALICAAKQTYDKYKVSQKKDNQEETLPIYIYSSGAQNPITWRRLIEYLEKHGLEWPTIRAVWYYSLIVTDNKHLFTILSFLFHTIPGYILDFLARFYGKEPVLTKIYSKMNNVRETLDYFRQRNWTFRNTNTKALWKSLDEKDKSLFFFDMSQVSWEYFLKAMALGLRVYLVNDDIYTLPQARKKWNRLYYIHTISKFILYGLLLYLLWTVLKLIFN